MYGTCARCGKEGAGDRYAICTAKAEKEGVKVTFSDMRLENVFLCDGCAVSAQRGSFRTIALVLSPFALCPLAGVILGVTQGAYISEMTPVLVIGLFFLALAGWMLYKMFNVKPTRATGELAAAILRGRAMKGQGRSAMQVSELPRLAQLHPELQDWLDWLVGQKPVGERDMQALREYTRHLAEQFWNTVDDETLTCDACNGPVARGAGYLIGQSLHCGSCANDRFGAQGLATLRHDPDFFGRGILEQAREFVANRAPA